MPVWSGPLMRLVFCLIAGLGQMGVGWAQSSDEPVAQSKTPTATTTTTPAPTPASATPQPPTPGTKATPISATMPLASATLSLEVLLVNDPDFPPVTPEHAVAILRSAQQTLGDKLNFPSVEFRIVGSTTAGELIAKHVKADDECIQHFEPLRVRPGVRPASAVDKKLVDQFLARWTVSALAAFFPAAERRGLNSYEAIRNKLLAEFDRKVELIASFKLSNGSSLLDPSKVEQRSYVSWVCALRNQDEADFVLTNAFILYDLASEPYPHSIFQKCKMGGASLLSPKRRAIYRRALVSSTFSMVTDLPFFQEDGVEWLTTSERLEVIGTFIVAHELGHAVFKIPDFYDHPPQCLMTTKAETGYISGFRELREHPGPCPKCQIYVDAKRQIFLAEEAMADKRYEDAIKAYKLAIQKTPKHVDGNYLRYVADLSVDIARAQLAKGDRLQAQRWAQAALRVVPDHEEALALKRSLAETP